MADQDETEEQVKARKEAVKAKVWARLTAPRSNPPAARARFREDPEGSLEPSSNAKSCQLTRKPDNKVLKAGCRVYAEEGNALRLAHGLGLPVPKVFEISKIDDDGKGNAILMEFADGYCLEDIWETMSSDEKMSIALDLRDFLSVLRAAPRNKAPIGACGGPARNCRQFKEHVSGPFEDEKDYNAFLLDFHKQTPRHVRLALEQTLDSGHEIVMTHADLATRNIMVKDGHVQAVIDWKFAGWYPEYWEFVRFFESPTSHRDWHGYSEYIFDRVYLKELAMFQAIFRWQR